jgi:hypothetical protein
MIGHHALSPWAGLSKRGSPQTLAQEILQKKQEISHKTEDNLVENLGKFAEKTRNLPEAIGNTIRTDSSASSLPNSTNRHPADSIRG